MQLTGQDIINNNIVTGCDNDCIQQQGVDLRVKNISYFDEICGYIPEEGKTKIPRTYPMQTEVAGGVDAYILRPGYYEIEFEQGCDIPRNATLHIKTRSSLVRCGAICHSGQFDGGFHTLNMGCFLHVINEVIIEKGARIAQAIVFESNPVGEEHLYNGQWQNDKQRTQ